MIPTTSLDAGLARIERSRPVVMLVEDDLDHRRIYGTLLWYNGFNVFVAPDVTRTRRVLSFLRPDLILLDLSLPDGDGLQICRTVRELDPGHPVPIVALSSFPTAQTEMRAVAAGCARYMEKQLSSPLAVLRAVEEILGRAPPSGEGATSWMLDYPSKDPPLDSL